MECVPASLLVTICQKHCVWHPKLIMPTGRWREKFQKDKKNARYILSTRSLIKMRYSVRLSAYTLFKFRKVHKRIYAFLDVNMFYSFFFYLLLFVFKLAMSYTF